MKQTRRKFCRVTTHVRKKRNPEKWGNFPSFLPRLRQQRGEINVLNNKILRTFWNTRGDFFFLVPFFDFSLFRFLLPHFCASWSLHDSFPLLLVGEKKVLNAKPVKEKFLLEKEWTSSITFYCLQLLFAAIISQKQFFFPIVRRNRKILLSKFSNGKEAKKESLN